MRQSCLKPLVPAWAPLLHFDVSFWQVFTIDLHVRRATATCDTLHSYGSRRLIANDTYIYRALRGLGLLKAVHDSIAAGARWQYRQAIQALPSKRGWVRSLEQRVNVGAYPRCLS